MSLDEVDKFLDEWRYGWYAPTQGIAETNCTIMRRQLMSLILTEGKTSRFYDHLDITTDPPEKG